MNLRKEEVQGRKVIEVGSMDVNGSLRPLLESFEPEQYVGVDIRDGPGVDVICDAENLLEEFGRSSFDVLVSTELLEHVRRWRIVVSNFKNLVKSEGIIFVTTVSKGFHYHGYPYDFWRYEAEDLRNIFSDCTVENIGSSRNLNVFIKVRKPRNFAEADLSNYKLYSVIFDERASSVNDEDLRRFFIHYTLRRRLEAYFRLGFKIAEIVKRRP